MIGKMDQRVTFQERSRIADSMGGATETWVDIASTPTVWADVMAVRGGERIDAERVTAEGIYLVRLRHRSDVDESMTMLWNSERYNIRRVRRSSGRTGFLTIEAERGAAA